MRKTPPLVYCVVFNSAFGRMTMVSQLYIFHNSHKFTVSLQKNSQLYILSIKLYLLILQ